MLLRYRSKRNYTMGSWVGPRIADKLIFSLVVRGWHVDAVELPA